MRHDLGRRLRRRLRRGMTLLELTVLMAVACAAVAMAIPLLARADAGSMRSVSQSNLRTLLGVQECYAADWNGRQFTAVKDDLSQYGDSPAAACAAYQNEVGFYPLLHTLLAGFDCEGLVWGFWNNCDAVLPMGFDGELWLGAGTFRIPNPVGLHEYLSGRMYDPTYFAPEDAMAYEAAGEYFDLDCEYPGISEVIPSSYAFSPAAMYDPAVFRPVAQGGFQHPIDLDDGYRSPPITAAKHPALKTWMLEHAWLRNPPADCNPGFEDPFTVTYSPKCSPYLFNHGVDAAPLTLFYDGSVQRLLTGRVLIDDANVFALSGGVDGLWSRDTPLGPDGYFGEFSYDGTTVSHHVLTTGGILGRDRLAGN